MRNVRSSETLAVTSKGSSVRSLASPHKWYTESIGNCSSVRARMGQRRARKGEDRRWAEEIHIGGVGVVREGVIAIRKTS
jgi:hypothetical protein